jgi:transposase InsO family protein
VGTKTLYIEPGSPWENGYCESFNGKLRDEFLNGEIFYSLKEADSDGEVARGIQHRAAALGPGLQATGATSHHPKTGARRCGKRSAFPTSPHPRRRLRIKVKRGVTLTLHLVHKIGPVTGRSTPPCEEGYGSG